MYCKRCGTDLPKNTDNCPRCGTIVNQTKRSSAPLSLNIVIACCFAVALITGTFLFVKNLLSKNAEDAIVIIALAFFFFLLCFLITMIVFIVFSIKRKAKTVPLISSIFCLAAAIAFFILMPTPDTSLMVPEVEAVGFIQPVESEGIILTEDSNNSVEPDLDRTDQSLQENSTIEDQEEQSEPDPLLQIDHRVGDEYVGISDKNIDDILNDAQVSNVRNDVTGNWRILTIAKSIQMEEYAISYYNKYFTDDNEIHAIVNFNYNTTTKIAAYGTFLNVTVFEYVSKEEHDAKLLFSGMVLDDYFVHLDNGDIERIV